MVRAAGHGPRVQAGLGKVNDMLKWAWPPT
jgi:hypothetical protein